jgi:hypothetical protein
MSDLFFVRKIAVLLAFAMLGVACESVTIAENRPIEDEPQQPTEQPVSVGGWIGRSLIPCIPVVGTIIYFIMLFVWMGDKTKEETFRNWAKAQLIVMGIAIGLVILLIIFSAALGVSLAESMY